MWFWCFMLAMSLLMPAMMLGFGKLWKKNPPGSINWAYGYRTKRSMKNEDTWEFAHKYVAKFWIHWGKIFLMTTAVLYAFLFGRDVETIGLIGGYYVLIQCIPLAGAVVPTERALKRTFDIHGQRIVPENGEMNSSEEDDSHV